MATPSRCLPSVLTRETYAWWGLCFSTFLKALEPSGRPSAKWHGEFTGVELSPVTGADLIEEAS